MQSALSSDYCLSTGNLSSVFTISLIMKLKSIILNFLPRIPETDCQFALRLNMEQRFPAAPSSCFYLNDSIAIFLKRWPAVAGCKSGIHQRQALAVKFNDVKGSPSPAYWQEGHPVSPSLQKMPQTRLIIFANTLWLCPASVLWYV